MQDQLEKKWNKLSDNEKNKIIHEYIISPKLKAK